jgi:hypothetical protein
MVSYLLPTGLSIANAVLLSVRSLKANNLRLSSLSMANNVLRSGQLMANNVLLNSHPMANSVLFAGHSRAKNVLLSGHSMVTCEFKQVSWVLQEVEDAMKWIEASLDPSRPDKSDELVSHFETTIRVVGGLLAAYHLHNGSVPVLGAAIDTGLRLLAAYANPEGLPHNVVFMGSLQAQDAAWTSSLTLAEATTLTLEFGYLSQV